MLHIKINYHFYKYVLDNFDTKAYKLNKLHQIKHLITFGIVKFNNKALKAIPLPKIFNHPDIIKYCSIIYKRKKVSPPI